MSARFSKDENMLLKILADELQGIEDDTLAEDVSWQSLFDMAGKHSVLSLLYRKVMESPLEENEKSAWISKIRKVVLQNYHLLFTAKYLVRILQDNDIPCVLLKGAGIAEYFPVPELRKSGDIDILILGEDSKKKSEHVLLEHGFVKSKEQHATHHTVWFSPEGIEVEVHTRLAEAYNHSSVNTYIDGLLGEIHNTICVKELMGVELPVLADGFQAYHLLLHMLTHYLHAGFGLRLLCDWVVFWNQSIEKKEFQRYKKLVAESGLQVFSNMITSVCVYFLGLRDPGLDVLESREKAEMFLKDVMEAEEFGSSDSDRMLVVNGTGIRDYAKEFHHQMQINHPRCGKIWLLWPVLWIVTLIRFVINNHKLRKTNSWKILKKTHERSRRIQELQLFEQKKERKRICFFSGDITRGGGTERVATMVANELYALGEYDIVFLSLVEQADKMFYPLHENIAHVALGERWISPGPGYLPLIRKVRKFVREQNIDVLVDIDIVLDVLSIPATHGCDTKVVSWEHFNYQFESSVLYRKCILKYSAKRSDYVVTLTERDKESYEKYLGRTKWIDAIYNPMQDVNLAGECQRKPWIITTGRLVEGKGLQYLVDLAEKILPKHPQWSWIVLGDGDMRGFLEEKLKEKGLENQVILKGMVKNVEEYLAQSSIYVLTSEHEGLPMVLLEAKAYKVPCVSFDIYTGPAEIIADGQDGYLVPPFDCQAMEQRIVSLMEDESLRSQFSQESTRHIDKFRMSTIIQRWNEVLKDLCD